ncbi:MAG TPA: gamma-glutamylcyclotransferase family protein [Acidimicrobiales bacterium]
MLFVYGTLLFPRVLAGVLGRVPDRAPASVTGWRAAALPGRPYPGLVPAPGRRARGQVLSGLTAGEWRRLDAFEGDAYDRRRLPLDGGGEAWAYVWLDEDDVSDDDWDPTRFAAEHLVDTTRGGAEWRDDLT